jgi:hypothetical protein
MSASSATVGRIVACTALAVLLGGYVGVVRGAEARLAAQVDDGVATARRTDDALRLLAAAPGLEAERRTLRDQLRQVDLGTDVAELVGHFLRSAADVAARHGASIVSVGAGDAAHPSGPAAEAVPLDVVLQGSYRALLGSLSDLSRTGVPCAIDVLSLSRVHPDGPDATLLAAVRISLQRLGASHTDAGIPTR